MSEYQLFTPEWVIEQIVKRIEAGESPRALSTSERCACSIIFDHPEWRPAAYAELDAALKRLGAWREATLNYVRIHGVRPWNKLMVLNSQGAKY